MTEEDVNFYISVLGALDKFSVVIGKMAELLADQTYQITLLKERVKMLEEK